MIPLCRRHHKIFEAVSLKFIESFNDNDFEIAKAYLNALIRGRQFETLSIINGIIQEKKSGIKD